MEASGSGWEEGGIDGGAMLMDIPLPGMIH